MKKEAMLFYLVLCTLLLPSILAELTPDQMYQSDILRLEVKESSSLDIRKGQGITGVDYVNAGLTFFPREEYRQKIEQIKTVPEAYKSKNMIQFSWYAPEEQKLTYEVNSRLTTVNEFKKVRDKVGFPLRSLPSDVLQFLESTKNIDANNPLITKKAQELSLGETDLFVLVSKTALWVKRNINYSLNTMTAEVSQSASWTLKNRVGVCDELTSLLIALLRAMGIPAKFVSGLSYSNSPLTPEKWGPHGWAEVYFPDIGWVPFDPTFGEFGWLDPSHVKMKESADPVDPATRFEWRGENIAIDIKPLEFETKVLQLGELIAPILGIKVRVLKNKVGFGSFNIFEAEVENLKDYYVASEVTLAKVKEIEVLDDVAKHLILKPFEKQKLSWQVKVRNDLQPKITYKIPVFLYTLRNETALAEFISAHYAPQYSLQELSGSVDLEKKILRDDKQTMLNLKCASSKEFYLLGETARINCIIQNAGTTSTGLISVCAEKNCQSFTLKAKEKYELIHTAENSKIGVRDFVVSVETDGFSATRAVNYSVLDVPRLEIQDVSLPKEILFGQKKRMKFSLAKKSWANPKNVIVRIEGARMVQEVDFDELEGDVPFIFVVDGSNLQAGDNEIKMQVKYKDNYRNNYATLQQANINLVNVTAEQKFRIWLRNTGDFIERLSIF